jgi:ATP-dependent exoDNAse (exonuclease V) beta subunit
VSRALDSPLMQRARRAHECYREVPFVLKLHDAIVEGALDLVFVEKGRLVLADFKTDRVTAQTADSHVAHYRPQFGLYALALKQVLGRPPDEAVVFFVRPLLERRIEVTAELLASASASVRTANGHVP